MADLTLNVSKDACPVAALADEARQLHRAYTAAEREIFTDENNVRLHAMRDAAFAFRLGFENRATFLRATSAKGAMFQLSLLASLIDDLESYAAPAPARADDWRPDATRAAVEKANRLLYSVAGYLEAASGIDLKAAAGDFWMTRRLDPFEHVREAIAAGAKEARERGEQ